MNNNNNKKKKACFGFGKELVQKDTSYSARIISLQGELSVFGSELLCIDLCTSNDLGCQCTGTEEKNTEEKVKIKGKREEIQTLQFS